VEACTRALALRKFCVASIFSLLVSASLNRSVISSKFFCASSELILDPSSAPLTKIVNKICTEYNNLTDFVNYYIENEYQNDLSLEVKIPKPLSIVELRNIKNDIEDILDLYFHLCSVEMTCKELSRAFLLYANHGTLLNKQKEIITPVMGKRINAIMHSCGFYDEAGEFSFKVGLPGKSGVGGGIAAIYPSKYAVAVWSPRLNPKGNSFLGMRALQLLTQKTKRSIF
jgi:hypothetical protein